jgi:hypothetical protein
VTRGNKIKEEMAGIEKEAFPVGDGMCHEGGVTPVKAQTIHELHSLQKKKKSIPTTPTSASVSAGPFVPAISEDVTYWVQLQSIRFFFIFFSVFQFLIIHQAICPKKNYEWSYMGLGALAHTKQPLLFVFSNKLIYLKLDYRFKHFI